MILSFRKALQLAPLQAYSDCTLLLLRLCVGYFLIWGVADNIASSERMDEFEVFLGTQGFPLAFLLAPLSVWAQCLVGAAFITGFLTRWAGIVCALNFLVALIMVDAAGGLRQAFPAACLISIGLYLATAGAGKISLDRLLLQEPAV